MPTNQYSKKITLRPRKGKPRTEAREYRPPAKEQKKARSDSEAAAGTAGGHKGVKGDGGTSAGPTQR